MKVDRVEEGKIAQKFKKYAHIISENFMRKLVI